MQDAEEEYSTLSTAAKPSVGVSSAEPTGVSASRVRGGQLQNSVGVPATETTRVSTRCICGSGLKNGVYASC